MATRCETKLLPFEAFADKGIPHCHKHIARLAKAKRFPQPVKLSAKHLAWVEEEIDAWIQARLAARGTSRISDAA